MEVGLERRWAWRGWLLREGWGLKPFSLDLKTRIENPFETQTKQHQSYFEF
jgi:hypothetical protein